MHKLFDKNGFLNFDDIIANHPSFKTIMEDGIITDSEIKQQADNTVAALKKLQTICSEEQQNSIVEALSELGVLFTVYHIHELQELNNHECF